VEADLEVQTLFFSYYTYRPQSVSDNRLVHRVSRASFMSPQSVAVLLKRCPFDQEVAFHSLVNYSDGTGRHLPMVDMATEKVEDLPKVNATLRSANFNEFCWFGTGRSFHGYGTEFMQEKDWISLMGTLLLCNEPHGELLVDPRWIGHRLLGGFAALRWTQNTLQYLSVPKKIEIS
jgi:hypothetical protein